MNFNLYVCQYCDMIILSWAGKSLLIKVNLYPYFFIIEYGCKEGSYVAMFDSSKPCLTDREGSAVRMRGPGIDGHGRAPGHRLANPLVASAPLLDQHCGSTPKLRYIHYIR